MEQKLKSRSVLYFLIIVLITSTISISSGLLPDSQLYSPFNVNMHYANNLNTIEQTYPLDPEARDKLNTNGFVVLDEYKHGYISDCYFKWCFEPDVSVFITSDAMLHIFHVVHDNMLKDIEKQHLYNSTELLVNDLQKKKYGGI